MAKTRQPRPRSRGDELEAQLRQASRDMDRVPMPGARTLPALRGFGLTAP
jgi:hypothetical protein